MDADFPIDEHFRIVQFTPPGSPASIQFGTGVTTMEPGAVRDIYLASTNVRGRPRGADRQGRRRQRGLARARPGERGP
jgi:hypothetical protein